MLKSSWDTSPEQDCLLLMLCLCENQHQTLYKFYRSPVCFPHLLNNLSVFPEHFLQPYKYFFACLVLILYLLPRVFLFTNSAEEPVNVWGIYVQYLPSVGRVRNRILWLIFIMFHILRYNFLNVSRETITLLLAESSWNASQRYCMVPGDLKCCSIT